MSDPVSDLLKEKGIHFTISGKDYVTKCFNPDHTDTNPSFRIDRVTGICHCFSCGYKANLFKHFGLLTNNISIRIVKLKDKLKALSESTNGLDMLEGAQAYAQVFRGISAKTLKHFGAFITHEVAGMEDRIIFPITDIRDKTVCFVGRHSMSNGNPRYMNYPTSASVPLFPTKFEERHTTMVLVEGVFDMLNCYDKGLKNVVCTFGTVKLMHDIPAKLLSYKVAGIEKIFIMYDGDEPGREAAKKMKPLIEEAGFLCNIINLPDDTDPGIMSNEDVESIVEYVKGK